MSTLVDTTEMYLKALFEMAEDGIAPMRARLAERLDQSMPTVSQTVARMERDGLLSLDEDRTVALTPLGRGYAMRIMRKHRLAKLLLLEVLGLDKALVHEEACRWEHVMSREVEERIVRVVASPCVDPFGNAVPGLADLGVEPCGRRDRGVALADVGDGRHSVVRIGEPAQADEDVLAALIAAGVNPDAEVEVTRADGALRVQVAGHDPLRVPAWAARHVFVAGAERAPE